MRKEMRNLGATVILGVLSINEETVKAFQSSVNKTIAALEMVKNQNCVPVQDYLLFTFVDGTRLKLWDGGQSCCEHRYMHTDDDLTSIIGAELMGCKLTEAPRVVDEQGTHEVQFLHIKTRKGVVTMETHNNHSGHYGGFRIRAAIVPG